MEYCDCLHDSRVSITTYRNEPKCVKTTISENREKKFLGQGLADTAGWVIRSTGVFFGVKGYFVKQ